MPYLTADRRLQPTSEQTYARGEDDTDSDASRPFVISLSHFAPLQELIPEKRMLVHGYLHKVSGSKPLWKQVERLEVWPAVRFASCCQIATIHVMPRSQPDIHVFGHTHLNIDSTYNGIRFVQVCERLRTVRSFLIPSLRSFRSGSPS